MASQEIIDFMVGRASGGPDASPAQGTPSRASKGELKHSSPRKAVQSVSKAFEKTVADWLETDETACKVMHSIANLRERVWHTSKLLAHQKKEKENDATWKQLGYRGVSREFQLTVDDLEMALDHDLQQHEGMLVQLRRVVAAVGLTQEALGRRLDEFYRIEMESGGFEQQRGLSLDDCQGLFTVTARELYRKQMLAAHVLESSANDGLLYQQDDRNEADSNDPNPRLVAHRCSVQWSRTHSGSPLLDYASLLNEIQQNAKE